jgi:hypothetical protein
MCKHPKTKFFAISSAINFFFLVVTAVLYMCCAEQMYQIHKELFHISRETFDALFYGFLGIYKLLFWVFNLVPLIALLIMNKCCHKTGCSSQSCGCDSTVGCCCKDNAGCSGGCKTKALNK